MSPPSPRDSDNDSRSSKSSNSTQTTRPNRWKGHPSTWRALTKADRSIAASLDTLRDRDLSVHLFNAHSLKRKARELEEVEKKGIEIPLLEDTRGFVPPKIWTAWPLPREDVPRLEDEVAGEDGLEGFTLRNREMVGVSGELEEVLGAIALRFAKEKFRKRVFDQEGVENQEEQGKKDRVQEGELDYTYVQSDSESGASREPSPTSSHEDENRWSGSESSRRARKTSRKVKKVTKEYVPVISADDDRSRNLLRPSIRHILSKLDDALFALHHARTTCLQMSRSDLDLDHETRSIASTPNRALEAPEKRAVGRPRKNANPSSPSKLPPEIKKTRAGRPKKEYPHLDGETQQEYLVRVARLQKKPLPSFAPVNGPSRSSIGGAPKRPKTPPTHQSGVEELFVSRNKKLDLRDWSEVLGAAAIIGFDPKVIERATQRCAVMFGESMSLRTLVEAPFGEPKDSMKTYQPDMIPEIGTEDPNDDLDSSEPSKEQEGAQTRRTSSRTTSEKQQSRKSRFCPIENCPRHTKAFRDFYAMKRHLRQSHKVFDEEVDDDLILSDEEMDGAVHVDGFLKPMKFALKARVLSSRPREKRAGSGRKFARKSRKAGRQEIANSRSVEEGEGQESGEISSDIESSPSEDE